MADPKAPEIPEGWVFDGDETSPGYENHAGDSFELYTDGLYIGVRHAGYHTHFFTELPLSVLRALLSAHGLHIVSEADRKVLALASDVAANFGQPRSAELEIAFMKAVNDMLRCAS
jgi:hypothetical protein